MWNRHGDVTDVARALTIAEKKNNNDSFMKREYAIDADAV